MVCIHRATRPEPPLPRSGVAGCGMAWASGVVRIVGAIWSSGTDSL